MARWGRLPWPEIATLVVALACLFVANLLRGEGTNHNDDVRSSYDASDNGTRAWYELLRRENVDVDRFSSRAFDLHGSGVRTLVVVLPQQTFGLSAALRSEVGDVASFVSSGGTLILIGVPDQETAAQLKLPKARWTFAYAIPHATQIDPELDDSGVHAIEISAAARYASTGGARVLLSDERGAFAIVQRLGAGQIVAVIPQDAFINSGISRSDNARLAYALATIGGDSRVFFDEHLHGFGNDRPWWSLISGPDRLALLLLAVAGLLWYASAGVRFGPAVTAPPRDPNSRDYLQALAGLYSRARADGVVMRRCAAAITHLSGRAVLHDARYERLVQFEKAEEPDPSELVEVVSLALALRKDLLGRANR